MIPFISSCLAGRCLALTLSLLALAAPSLSRAGELRVTRILPQGDQVTQTDSIQFTFNNPMVPLGQMERKSEQIPIQIRPAVSCEWRWISPTTLACKLSQESPLKRATRYEVTIQAGFNDLAGNALASEMRHSFITQRPQVTYSGFQRWLGPGFPVVHLNFNLNVTAESVSKTMKFVTGNESVGIKLLPKKFARETFHRLRSAEELIQVIRTVDAEPSSSESFWMAVPTRELKAPSPVNLVITPGLATTEGPEKGAEERTVIAFHTFPPFRFEGVACTGTTLKAPIAPQPCDPIQSIYLAFSTPLNIESVKKACKISPLKDAEAESAYWDQAYSHGPGLYQPHQEGGLYAISLPALLKARSTFSLNCTTELTDAFGRKLTAPLQTSIQTAARAPKLDMSHRLGILEKQVDSEVPVYVTNLKEVRVDFSTLTARGAKAPQSTSLPLQNVEDLSYALPLDLRSLLGNESGAASVKLSSVASPNPEIGFFQVTPFYVHLKEGHFNSVAWVRDFATGNPVEGAEVSLLAGDQNAIHLAQEKQTFGVTDSKGLAQLPGYVSYNPTLTQHKSDLGGENLFIRVKKGQDIALLPLTYSFISYSSPEGMGTYIYPRLNAKHGHLKIWGTSPQGVYRSGDVIEYKIYVREQNERKLIRAPQTSYTLFVKDPTGQEVHRQEKIRLNEFGGFHGSFKTAKSAAVGWYQFHVTADFMNPAMSEAGTVSGSIPSHSVLVTDFTPAPFRPENELDRDRYELGETMRITSRAKLHSGGPYGDAKTRINVTLSPTSFAPEHPLASRFNFSCSQAGYWGGKTLYEKEEKLGAQGELLTPLKLEERSIGCGKLLVTTDIADDRGKYYSAAKGADFFGVSRFVGLRRSKFFYKEGEEASFEFLVTDPSGKPMGDIPVTIDIEREERKIARVKGPGNAYLEEAKTRWDKVGGCNQQSGSRESECRFRPEKAGAYRIIAKVKDPKGRENSHTEWLYVTGSTRVVWEGGESNALSIVPEKKSPKVGERARYLVKNPFPGAEALISLERYGVIRSWTQRFETSSPIVEFEVEEDLLPGFYLSVVVFSPRVAQPLGAGNVDLGKPAFKSGYVEILPENPVKEIEVSVAPKEKVYRPGEKVSVQLESKSKSAIPLGTEVEFAVAVLDEAVFDLINGGSKYFDVYRGFYKLDGLDVTNYSLLMQLIGRQKFEKKGANTGGDGGGLSARSFFKYVAYWNPSLKADPMGKANFDFTVPDNLTGWRVLAIAVTPEDRMGLGQGEFKVNRPTEIRPVMPNQVHEGDLFRGAFSVMNRTEQKRKIKVSLKAQGDIATDTKSQVSLEKTIEAEPFKRVIVDMPILTSPLPESRLLAGGKVIFTVGAGDHIDQDGLVHELPVLKKRSLLSAASYGSTTEPKASEAIEFPKEIYTDIGHLSVQASSTVIGNLEGAFRYLRGYPYSCWEQRLTKGTMASSYVSLRDYLDSQFQWNDAAGIPKNMLEDAASFQAQNGGMCYYVASDERVSPYLSAFTALAFSWLKKRGLEAPQGVTERLHAYLLQLIRGNTYPDFYSKGMASTVRAVALAALASERKLPSSEIERYRAYLKEMDLFGKALFLQAALRFEDRQAAAKDALALILGSANETAGKFRFTEDLDSAWLRIHSTELRTQCAILSAVSHAAALPWAKEMIQDVPFKLTRFITQSRGAKDRWENTQENLFCTEALVDYSRRFEAEKPALVVQASWKGKPFGSGELKGYQQKPLVFRKEISASDPGTKGQLEIARKGNGRLYHTTILSYAPKESFSTARNAGIEIRRELSVERGGKFVLLTPPMRIKQGELVRVDLYLSLPSARNFLVVDDPVPGGLEPLNEDLANTSKVDASKARSQMDRRAHLFSFEDWIPYFASFWSFYHREVRHDSVRFYSEYLEKGRYHLSYTAQAIGRGTFALLPVHAEEMYDPDVYGKGIGGTLEIEEP